MVVVSLGDMVPVIQPSVLAGSIGASGPDIIVPIPSHIVIPRLTIKPTSAP